MTDESDETAPARPVAKRKPARSGGRKAVIGKLWNAAQTQLRIDILVQIANVFHVRQLYFCSHTFFPFVM